METRLRKNLTTWIVWIAIVIFLGLYLALLFPWMNRWGITDKELNMPLPGDGVQPGMIITSTRGITISAPAREVWKWVVQLGQDQAGFYSHDWLENLVLADIHNQADIHPEWQAHHMGDPVLGAGGAVYGRNFYWPTLAYAEGKMLYLWGPVVVQPVDGQTSRLFLRSYAEPSSLLKKLTYDWMHFVMERGMLLGIKARAEGKPQANALLQGLSATGWVLSTLSMAIFLFRRRRGWWWGLIPLVYAAAVAVFTHDLWSAMAAFLWWGVIAAGFLEWGHAWWKWLSLAVVSVIWVFVLTPQPHIAFGLIFLSIILGCLGIGVTRKALFVPFGRVLRVWPASQAILQKWENRAWNKVQR